MFVFFACVSIFLEGCGRYFLTPNCSQQLRCWLRHWGGQYGRSGRLQLRAEVVVEVWFQPCGKGGPITKGLNSHGFKRWKKRPLGDISLEKCNSIMFWILIEHRTTFPDEFFKNHKMIETFPTKPPIQEPFSGRRMRGGRLRERGPMPRGNLVLFLVSWKLVVWKKHASQM